MLLEVILALFVFSIAMVALTVGFNKRLKVSAEINKQAEINNLLERVLREASIKPREQMFTEGFDEELGITYKTEVEDADFTLESGEPLQSILKLKANATWKKNKEPQEQEIFLYLIQNS